MIFKTKEKEYTLEYTFEAALNRQCVDNAFNLTLGVFGIPDGKEGEADTVKKQIQSISALPIKIMELFYAGLLEHHGPDGDGSVLAEKDAIKIYKEFSRENKEDARSDFYGLMSSIIETMEKDGFFKQIGLDQMMSSAEEVEEKKTVPTDHKKKESKKLSVVE